MSKPSNPSRPGSSMDVNLGSSSGSAEPRQPSAAEQSQLTRDSLARFLSDIEPSVVILGAQPPVADEQAEPLKPQGK